jgi:NTE family protein
VIGLIHGQVGSLRKRTLIASFEREDRQGAYWGITGDIKHYDLSDSLECPFEMTTRLAGEPTRLARMDTRRQEELINWGYAICDAALRRHVDTTIAAPKGFPYPAVGVG